MTPNMTICKQLLFLICAAINLLSCRIILHRLWGAPAQRPQPWKSGRPHMHTHTHIHTHALMALLVSPAELECLARPQHLPRRARSLCGSR